MSRVLEYGFYIYRNGRLISWAASLGFVPQDQNLYSFRGRLEITSDADEILNIDVTKSRLHLSDVAYIQFNPLAREALKKSRNAWSFAGEGVTARANLTPHDDINEQLSKINEIEDKNDQLDEDVAPEEEREKLRERRQGAQEAKPTTGDESEKLRTESQRVQYVATLFNNQLWERAHDPSDGLIVRVNSAHRFVRDVVDTEGNPGLTKAFDLLMFALARSEYSLIYKSEHKSELIEAVMQEYRERFGGELSDILRKIETSQSFPST